MIVHSDLCGLVLVHTLSSLIVHFEPGLFVTLIFLALLLLMGLDGTMYILSNGVPFMTSNTFLW